MRNIVACLCLVGALGCGGEFSKRVECWSGGVPIYDGYSRGGVRTDDGMRLSFNDRASGRQVKIIGHCVVTHVDEVIR